VETQNVCYETHQTLLSGEWWPTIDCGGRRTSGSAARDFLVGRRREAEETNRYWDALFTNPFWNRHLVVSVILSQELNEVVTPRISK
jgi:hypothetical protein